VTAGIIAFCNRKPVPAKYPLRKKKKIKVSFQVRLSIMLSKSSFKAQRSETALVEHFIRLTSNCTAVLV